MGKAKPTKVFQVRGVIVLARHAKGAATIAREHGASGVPVETSPALASRAVNHQSEETTHG